MPVVCLVTVGFMSSHLVSVRHFCLIASDMAVALAFRLRHQNCSWHIDGKEWPQTKHLLPTSSRGRLKQAYGSSARQGDGGIGQTMHFESALESPRLDVPLVCNPR